MFPIVIRVVRMFQVLLYTLTRVHATDWHVCTVHTNTCTYHVWQVYLAGVRWHFNGAGVSLTSVLCDLSVGTCVLML